jgi:protein-tyrosine phosphatase
MPGYVPPSPHLDEVCPSVFVASARVARDVTRLQECEIRLVVVAANSVRPPDEAAIVAMSDGKDDCAALQTEQLRTAVLDKAAALNAAGRLAYVWLKLEDNPRQNLAPYFVPIAATIAAAVARESKVLVHCLLGVSRSVSLVAAYMLLYPLGPPVTLKAVLDSIRTVRPSAEPQPTFGLQLFKLERTLANVAGTRADDGFRDCA